MPFRNLRLARHRAAVYTDSTTDTFVRLNVWFLLENIQSLGKLCPDIVSYFVRSTLKLGLPYFSINASIEITLQTTSIPICFLSTETFAFCVASLAQLFHFLHHALLMPKDSPQLPQPQYFLPCNFPVPSSLHGNW